MRRKPGVLVLAMLAALVAAAPASAAPAAPAAPAGATTAQAPPALHGAHPCPDQPGFTCATLTVPLDHSGRHPGTLDLAVATADNAGAPKGVLVDLTGGPGQGGVDAITRLTGRLPAVAKDYRFVMFDQRGTGAGALNCPRLQATIGSSDIATPDPAAVTECARILGDTAPYYSTEQTVADLDALRAALGADKVTVDGTSYGSFVAARYAIAHPARVNKLVLDSVVWHRQTPADALYLAGLTAQARVLRTACAAAPRCGYDPAADLALLVRKGGTAEGVRLFDMIVSSEFADPTYRAMPDFPPGGGVVDALHAARLGNPANLTALEKAFDPAAEGAPPEAFSSGLHAATVCADFRFPWGSSATPVPLRRPLLDLTRRLLPPAATWPYTSAVATTQGFTTSCLPWPVERPDNGPDSPLPAVPTLMVNGDHDLSTPLEIARSEARQWPHATLVVVPGAAHSIQNRERGTVGRAAVTHFLVG